MPIFSVIIPIYNVEKYIRQCIESVLNQTFTDFEVLCVDDCGTDDSINIVKEYAKVDKRIKIIYQGENKGVGAARNMGINSAKGKYVIFLDSDDWWETNCLEVVYNAFQKYRTSSIIFDGHKYIEKSQTLNPEAILKYNEGYLTFTPENIFYYSDYCFKAYTKESIIKHNIFYPEGLTYEDSEFYYKYFTLNPKTYIISNCLYNYRIRENSITQTTSVGMHLLENVYQVAKNIHQFYIDNNLLEKYKSVLIQLLKIRLNLCHGFEKTDKAYLMANELLNKWNFPDEFKEFDLEINPLVTVVVPIYNVEKYVEKCIRSIQAQTYKNLEILCIDDCGSDNSMRIVQEIAKYDSRIKIIKNEENKGLGYSRNVGINQANGDFLFFVDSDDWMQPECISAVVEKFKQTGLNTVWFKTDMWWQDAKKSEPFYCQYYNSVHEGYFNVDETNIALFTQYAWNKAYRTEFLFKNKIYFPEGIYFEDIEFFFKLFVHSPVCYMIDKVFYTYRRNSESIIGQCVRDYKKAADTYISANGVYEFLKNNELFEKYKDMYISFLLDMLNMYRNFPEIHKKLLPIMQKYLNNLKL